MSSIRVTGTLLQIWMSAVVLAFAPIGAAIAFYGSPDERSPDLDPAAESVLLEVSKATFARPGQQKEAFEFLWTPGLVLQQTLQDNVLVAYPPE